MTTQIVLTPRSADRGSRHAARPPPGLAGAVVHDVLDRASSRRGRRPTRCRCAPRRRSPATTSSAMPSATTKTSSAFGRKRDSKTRPRYSCVTPRSRPWPIASITVTPTWPVASSTASITVSIRSRMTTASTLSSITSHRSSSRTTSRRMPCRRPRRSACRASEAERACSRVRGSAQFSGKTPRLERPGTRVGLELAERRSRASSGTGAGRRGSPRRGRRRCLGDARVAAARGIRSRARPSRASPSNARYGVGGRVGCSGNSIRFPRRRRRTRQGWRMHAERFPCE